MEDYNVEGLLLLVKALHTSILFILMFFACFCLYFSRLVQVVMKTALTVTLIIMMIVTRDTPGPSQSGSRGCGARGRGARA